MSRIASAYPLQWPDGWPRTKTAERSRFDCTLDKARLGIVRSLGLSDVGDWNIVISTNVELRADGNPHGGRRDPYDTGAAVYWRQKDKPKVLACDRWDRVKDNLRAIENTLEALRGISRWGTSDIVDKAFSGFTALPPAAEGWRETLGHCDTRADAHDSWKLLALNAHPDRGGSDAEMAKINAAYKAAFAELPA